MKLTLTRADEDELILRCRDPDAPHIRALLALLGGAQRRIPARDGTQLRLLAPADVLYAEAVERHTFLYTRDAVYETPLTLAELEQLSLLSLLEMLLVSFAIAALQSFILPDGTDYSRGVLFGRAVAWAGASALAIFAASLWGSWLAAPGWLPGLLLGAAMFAGLIAMLIGEQFKQEIETDQLNEALRRRRPTE